MRLDRQSQTTLLLTLGGIAVAIYLVYVHYQEHALVCGLGNCEKVQTSSYAELAGIPIAWLGLGTYILILGLQLLAGLRPATAEIATIALFGITLAGTLFVAYLTYLEIWVIEAICQWCVSYAIITTILFILFAARLWQLVTEIDDPSS